MMDGDSILILILSTHKSVRSGNFLGSSSLFSPRHLSFGLCAISSVLSIFFFISGICIFLFFLYENEESWTPKHARTAIAFPKLSGTDAHTVRFGRRHIITTHPSPQAIYES